MSQIIYPVKEFIAKDITTCVLDSTDIVFIGEMKCRITGKGVIVGKQKGNEHLIAIKVQVAQQKFGFLREIKALLHLASSTTDITWDHTTLQIDERNNNQCTASGFHPFISQLLIVNEDLVNDNLTLGTTLGTGGTFTGLLQELKRSLEPNYEAWFYAMELCEAVTHLHEQGIIHHDIKEENVFIQADGHLLLGDFGLAIQLPFHSTCDNIWRNQSAHMPPEIHSDILNWPQGKRKYQISHTVDWFSVGVFLYVLLTRRIPFSKPLIPPNAPFRLSLPPALMLHNLRDFLTGLLHPSATSRLGNDIYEVLGHIWICNTNEKAKYVIQQNGIHGFRRFIKNKVLEPPFKPLDLTTK